MWMKNNTNARQIYLHVQYVYNLHELSVFSSSVLLPSFIIALQSTSSIWNFFFLSGWETESGQADNSPGYRQEYWTTEQLNNWLLNNWTAEQLNNGTAQLKNWTNWTNEQLNKLNKLNKLNNLNNWTTEQLNKLYNWTNEQLNKKLSAPFPLVKRKFILKGKFSHWVEEMDRCFKLGRLNLFLESLGFYQCFILIYTLSVFFVWVFNELNSWPLWQNHLLTSQKVQLMTW